MYNMIKEELNTEKTLTENGAVAYATSGKNLVDFNFAISKLRNSSEEEIQSHFMRVFYDDKMTAVKFLFYVGDVRGGLGERHIFKSCFKWLIKNQVEIAQCVTELIPEYTRWDNMIAMLGEDVVTDATIIGIIKYQIADDIANMTANKSISLLAKWMPSENTSSYKTRKKARLMMASLGLSAREYRKTLSALRKYLNVIEVKVSAKEWDKISYESVPSKANIKYKNAFMKHDEDRRRQYLEALNNGEAKINAGTLNPDDIVGNYYEHMDWSREVKQLDPTLEELWKNQIDYETGNAIVVRDGSGSMYGCAGGRPAKVATALAIYMAERAKGEFKNKFITFSNKPKLVDITNANTLREKIMICENESEVASTDIEKTMRLILSTAVHNKMKQEEMPESIIIISDMQFNFGSYSHWDTTLFESISREFNENGYKLPKIIFWNVTSTYSGTIPMQKNELGLVLCSGYSTANLKMVMSNEVDPYKILLNMINAERYYPVEEKLAEML